MDSPSIPPKPSTPPGSPWAGAKGGAQDSSQGTQEQRGLGDSPWVVVGDAPDSEATPEAVKRHRDRAVKTRRGRAVKTRVQARTLGWMLFVCVMAVAAVCAFVFA